MTLTALLGSLGTARGQEPEALQPLTLVTPFVAGSGPDQVARAIARAWSMQAGEPVVVLNLPDDQGRPAARWVAERGTDGRLALLTSSRMLDAGPSAPRVQRSAPPVQAPVPLERFRLLALVGDLPFMSVFPQGLLPGPLRVVRAAPGSTATQVDPRVLAAVARLDDLTADPTGRMAAPSGAPAAPAAKLLDRPWPAGHRVFPPLLSPPDDFPRSDWNGLLVSEHMPKARAVAMIQLFARILAQPEVRWAVSQAGSDLWELPPRAVAIEVTPLER